MSDATEKPVSMSKGADGDVPGKAPRPREVAGALVAVIVAAVASLAGGLSLFPLTGWLRVQLTNSYANTHKGKTISASDLVTQVHNAKVGGVQQAVIAVLALSFIGYGIYRGRYWSRWGVLAVWALGSFSGMPFGLFSLPSIAAKAPVAYKLPLFVSAAAMLVALVLTNLRKSTEYFALNRPVPAAGAPTRGGLFGPRPARPARPPVSTAPAKTARTTTDAGAGLDRARTKKRAETAAAVAKGADLARTRAKAASKSRRRADG